VGRELIGQPALPDARLSGQEEEPTAARDSIVEAGDELSHLAFPPNETALGARFRDGRCT